MLDLFPASVGIRLRYAHASAAAGGVPARAIARSRTLSRFVILTPESDAWQTKT